MQTCTNMLQLISSNIEMPIIDLFFDDVVKGVQRALMCNKLTHVHFWRTDTVNQSGALTLLDETGTWCLRTKNIQNALQTFSETGLNEELHFVLYN